MPFHRLTVPSYFGGLPGGYDYINNAASGTPAPANNVQSSGTYTGSYFIGVGDAATAANMNRIAKALAQNDDFIDDILRKDIAVPAVTADATVGGSALTSLVLTGPIFVGHTGTPNTTQGIATFVAITDDNNNPIIRDTGPTSASCKVTAITGATPGDGFSAGNVTLTISPGIAVGRTYRVHYFVRGNVANFADNSLADLSKKALSTPNTQNILAPALSGTPIGVTDLTLFGQLGALLGSINTLAKTLRTFRASAAATDSLLDTDGTVYMDGIPATPTTFNLPNPANVVGHLFLLVDRNGLLGGAPFNLTRFGSEKIDGVAATKSLTTANSRVFLLTDGTDWFTMQLAPGA